MKKIVIIALIAVMFLALAACGGTTAPEAKNVDLAAVYETFCATLPEMFTMDEATMLNFLGIEAADCKQVITATYLNGLRSDEVWLIEANDQAALDKLLKLAETRIEAKLGEAAGYTPDQYVIVENAELITEGLYLALLVSPDVDTLKQVFEDAVK